MGQVKTCGPQALEFLQRILSNDVRRIPEGGAQYSLMCREDGGILDDLIVYRMGEHYLVVVNAGNKDSDFEWMSAHRDGADFRDVSNDYALLAVQGPDAVKVVTTALIVDPGVDLNAMASFSHSGLGSDIEFCRTGYTGEHGYELIPQWDDALALWDARRVRLVPSRHRVGQAILSLHRNGVDPVTRRIRGATGPEPVLANLPLICQIPLLHVGRPDIRGQVDVHARRWKSLARCWRKRQWERTASRESLIRVCETASWAGDVNRASEGSAVGEPVEVEYLRFIIENSITGAQHRLRIDLVRQAEPRRDSKWVGGDQQASAASRAVPLIENAAGGSVRERIEQQRAREFDGHALRSLHFGLRLIFRALLLQRLEPSAGISKGEVFYYLGEISARQGDRVKALQMFERAIENDPALERARAKLTELKG